MFKDIYEQMDRDQNGRITKEEYLKLNSFRAGEKVALDVFQAMDTSNNEAVGSFSLQ